MLHQYATWHVVRRLRGRLAGQHATYGQFIGAQRNIIRAAIALLFQLATDLPAAVLAGMLGIHISVAVQWQRASAGDWTAYAADVSRRARALSPAE